MNTTSKSFELDPSQLELLNGFMKKHVKKCATYKEVSKSMIGGGLTFTFYPTGLSNGAKVICSCGCELDLDPIENW